MNAGDDTTAAPAGEDRAPGPAAAAGESAGDAFARLGIPRRLAIDVDAVRARFHEASRSRHPDVASASGAPAEGEEEFEALITAEAILRDPGRRARHWLELEFGSLDQVPGGGGAAGSIDPRLMDLFAAVGEVIRSADTVIAKRRGSRSPLARALLEREVFAVQRRIGEAVAEVGSAAAEAEARLAEVDARWEAGDREAAAALALRSYRELAFLGKWRAQLQERFGLLFA